MSPKVPFAWLLVLAMLVGCAADEGFYYTAAEIEISPAPFIGEKGEGSESDEKKNPEESQAENTPAPSPSLSPSPQATPAVTPIPMGTPEVVPPSPPVRTPETSPPPSGPEHGENPESPTPCPTPNREEEEKNERISCAKWAGVRPDKVVIVRKGGAISMQEGQAILLRVVGNRSSLEAVIRASEAGLKAVCVTMAGNQSRLSLRAESHIEKFLYLGRGNQSEGRVFLTGRGYLRNLRVDLKGHDSRLELAGPEGSYLCPTPSPRGLSCR